MDVFSNSNSRFSIVNHRLVGGGVIHLVCEKNRRTMGVPEMIILHYTAGRDAMSSAKFLVRPEVKASTHLVIGRDGQVIQLVPFNIEAWHAGKSSYKGRSELNHYSIGIELDNLGQLQQEGGRFVAECGKEVPVKEVYSEDSGEMPTYWHDYTDEQMRVLNEVCGLLVDTYPIGDIVGHSDVTPRKVDPGPALRVAEWIRYY